MIIDPHENPGAAAHRRTLEQEFPGVLENSEYRERIDLLLNEVGLHYTHRGVVSTTEYHSSHDVHAFYTLAADPSRVIHVQGYPGLSSENRARVRARMMDYEMMMALKDTGDVSVGNEHEAVVQEFPNFGHGVDILYNPKVLEDMLEANVPELRGE